MGASNPDPWNDHVLSSDILHIKVWARTLALDDFSRERAREPDLRKARVSCAIVLLLDKTDPGGSAPGNAGSSSGLPFEITQKPKRLARPCRC